MLKFLKWLFGSGAPKRATTPNELDLQSALERGCAIRRQMPDGSYYEVDPALGKQRQQAQAQPQQQPQQHRPQHPQGHRHGGGPQPNGRDPNHRPGSRPN